MNMDAYLAFQRARMKTASARADARLRELGGGESVSRRDLTVSEIEADTATLKRFLERFKGGMKRAHGRSTIQLPSGREHVIEWGGRGGYERAITRPHKYQHLGEHQ
jgi:hypothetical protein